MNETGKLLHKNSSLKKWGGMMEMKHHHLENTTEERLGRQNLR